MAEEKKVAVITGGARGIGKAIAHTWVEVFYDGKWIALEGVITDEAEDSNREKSFTTYSHSIVPVELLDPWKCIRSIFDMDVPVDHAFPVSFDAPEAAPLDSSAVFAVADKMASARFLP